eukprot:TRINITY_DN20078_c0_g3_i3.p1 TRINITY_DN20078_c0_g3~~TRINITY_DN20078_c0_g3_i3.p1  ORF type:complete len:402 (+),score=58.49 TRINITY_DN20078_c0_g3_i3:103-1308(+)
MQGRKRPFSDLGLQLQCPCCYRPGSPVFCGAQACAPADAARKLQGLRALLEAHGIDGYLVTSQDAHSSEYIAAADERRAFLTGFTGSAGTALVTHTQALLWTDSRYFLQAAEQLKGTDWILMRQFQPGVLEMKDWVLENCADGFKMGLDPALVPHEIAQGWKARWSSKAHVVEVSTNLIDSIWFPVKPVDACNPILVHPQQYAGETVGDKLSRVRDALKSDGAEALIISALDQVAWLFNLRGSDIECNPVFFSYAIVLPDTCMLFVRALDNEGDIRLSEEAQEHLRSASVTVKAYKSFFAEAKDAVHGKRTFLDPASCSLAIMSLVASEMRILGTSPVELFKARKNDKEAEGLRQASKRDSTALCELFARLEQQLQWFPWRVTLFFKNVSGLITLFWGSNY